MKIFLFLLFISNVSYCQLSCLTTEEDFKKDTLIFKDEYYEILYQLNQCRMNIDSLETKNQILDWETKAYEKLLSIYKEQLVILGANPRNRKKKKQ